MALSVSAFPEHIQARHSDNAISTSDDGNTRNVVNTPRILGLFGGVSYGASSKKPELQPSPRLDDELDRLNTLDVYATTTAIPTASTFQFSPQEDEQKIEFEEQAWAQTSSRQPFSRKTPSPIRLGAPLAPNRLELAPTMRSLPFPTHVPSKSSPPLIHTTLQWGSNDSSSNVVQAVPSSRPLPIVPNPASDGWSSSSPLNLPSRSTGAVAVPSAHLNALPSPPTRPSGNASKKASPPSTASPITPPSSKVLITQAQRGQRANSTSVSMRYQPLAVDPSSPDTPTPASPSPKQKNDTNIVAPNAIRPLPHVPPLLSPVTNFGLPSSANSACRTHVPLKRPRTSPGSFSGFSGLTSSSNSHARTAFENIPSSWASKPSLSRPSSPPWSSSTGLLRPTISLHPRRPPSQKGPRARSWSRTRREKSYDSYTRLSSGTPRTLPSSAGSSTSFSLNAGASRSLNVARYSSQALTGARSFTKKPNVTPIVARKGSPSARDMSTGLVLRKKPSPQISIPTSSSLTRNSTLYHVCPHSPPSVPVIRTGSTTMTSPTTTATLPDQFDNLSRRSSKPSVVQTTDSTSFMEPLHIHPFTGNDDLSCRMSTEISIDSPLEFFVDGPETDVTSVNRSPSPIRYALPPGNGESSDWESTNDEETSDDDLGGVSSSTSNSRGLAVGRRRTQLRSYRMDYGPRTNGHLPDDSERMLSSSPGETTLKPPRALPIPPEKKKSKEENKKKEKWSFGDFTSMGSLSSSSTPGTRASSPERKGRSRQPRRLAEAVSLALGSSSRHIHTSHSRSKPGSVSETSQPVFFAGLSQSSSVHPSDGEALAESEVLDIRMPSDGKIEPCNNSSFSPVSLDFRIHESSSTLRAHLDSSDAPISVKRSPVVQANSRNDFVNDIFWVGKDGKPSGLRHAPVESRIIFRHPSDDEYESEDMPFMWLSRDKPQENVAPAISMPSHRFDDRDHPLPELERDSHFASSLLLKSPRREAFPIMVPSTLPSPSTLIVYPMNRGRDDDLGRKQRTTSGPSRFNLSEGSNGVRNKSTLQVPIRILDHNADVQFMNTTRREVVDDDIYCDEESNQNLGVQALDGGDGS